MPTILEIKGEPRVALTFYDLPSRNKIPSKRRAKGAYVKKWNLYAQQVVAEFKRDLPEKYKRQLMFGRAFVHVRIYTPRQTIMDIHNKDTKPMYDGFTKQKVWKDDEWTFVPLVLCSWAGNDENPEVEIKRNKKGKEQARKKQRTVVEIHELEAFIINGERQPLPLGRTWL